jgi:hypothetical protein
VDQLLEYVLDRPLRRHRQDRIGDGLQGGGVRFGGVGYPLQASFVFEITFPPVNDSVKVPFQ